MDKPGSSFFNFWRNLFDRRATPTKAPVTVSTQTRFSTTLDANDSDMLSQLREATKYRDIIEEAARQYNFPPSVIAGIGSRESRWGLALKPQGPTGRGDFAKRAPRGERTTPEPPDGGGYGRGLMQIDYDWQEFARTGNWQSPRENIFYACKVLNDAKTFIQQRLNLTPDQLLQAAIAAYNCGATAEINVIKAGQDFDEKTAHKNYSRDVLSRSGWFQLKGWS